MPVLEGAAVFVGGPPSFLAGTFVVAEEGEEIGGPLDTLLGGPPGGGVFVGTLDGAFAPGIDLVGDVGKNFLTGALDGPCPGGGPPIDFLTGAFDGEVAAGPCDFLTGALLVGTPGALEGILAPSALLGTFGTEVFVGAVGGELGSFLAGGLVGGAVGASACLEGSLLGGAPGTFPGTFLAGGPPALKGDFFTPPFVGGEGSFLAPVSFGFFKLKIRCSLCFEVGFSAWDILLDQVLQVVRFHSI
jgi:hypothetical protein